MKFTALIGYLLLSTHLILYLSVRILDSIIFWDAGGLFGFVMVCLVTTPFALIYLINIYWVVSILI